MAVKELNLISGTGLIFMLFSKLNKSYTKSLLKTIHSKHSIFLKGFSFIKVPKAFFITK